MDDVTSFYRGPEIHVPVTSKAYYAHSVLFFTGKCRI